MEMEEECDGMMYDDDGDNFACNSISNFAN